MVEDRVTDGKRIGQLLASELTGLERGPLGKVSVVDADPDVEPTAAGAQAFHVAVEGDTIGTVTVTPETARLALAGEPDGCETRVVDARDDVTVEEGVVVAHSGAAVKTLVDVVAERLA